MMHETRNGLIFLLIASQQVGRQSVLKGTRLRAEYCADFWVAAPTLLQAAHGLHIGNNRPRHHRLDLVFSYSETAQEGCPLTGIEFDWCGCQADTSWLC